MSTYRLIVSLLGCLLPRRTKNAVYRRLLHYDISETARVGLTLILVENLFLGEGVSIGHLNFIRGHESVTLQDHSAIGSLNWIGAHPRGDTSHYASEVDRRPYLKVGRHAAITSRHLIDCTAGVTIGEYATVAGFRSQLLTHSIDLELNRQASREITIGTYSFVSTASVLLPGTSLPDFSVLGAGSVLTKGFEEPYCLYAGQPARKIKVLSKDLEYFTRAQGFVL